MAISGLESGAGLAAANTETLVSNLTSVQQGKALGLDERGDLIGAGVKEGFRGKVVDLLVRSGIAKEGNLGGRLAAGLVGKDNFDLILDAHRNPKQYAKSTVSNALKVFEKIQNDAFGTDFVNREAIGSAIGGKLSTNTPLRKLAHFGTANGGGIREVAATITKTLENQRAHRQEVIDKTANGEPTDKIRKAYPDELRQAYRGISKEGVATGEAQLRPDDRDDITFLFTAGRESKAGERALGIVDEFNRAAALIHGQTPDGQNASERVEAFRAQYLDALRSEFEYRDADDGQRLRDDGLASAPINDKKVKDGTTSSVRFAGHELGAANGRPAEEVRTYSPRDGTDAASSERAAFPGVEREHIGAIALRAQDTLDTIRDLHQDALEADNFAQLDDFAKDLRRISTSSATEPGQKAEAASLALTLLQEMSHPRPRDPEDLATRAAICDSYKGMSECLQALQSQARRDPEIAKEVRALEADIRATAEADVARASDMAANPQNHRAFFEAYDDALTMEVFDAKVENDSTLKTRVVKESIKGPELDFVAEALTELKAVQSNAGMVLHQLNRIVAGS